MNLVKAIEELNILLADETSTHCNAGLKPLVPGYVFSDYVVVMKI